MGKFWAKEIGSVLTLYGRIGFLDMKSPFDV